MKKILLSATSIIFAIAIIAGGTYSTFQNKNKSSGNTFASGIIDLKVDNESYVTDENGILVYSPETSWGLSPLAGKFFFKFPDIKPGDIGEDTISLHVKNNKAWACMNILLTSTLENGQTGPEDLIDPTGHPNGGELQDNLYFKFWADDGDNVYEVGENIFKRGWVKDIFNGKNWTLADSSGNIWGGTGLNAPIPANSVKYIGKAWCFGDMAETPVAQDGIGKTGNNGPLARGTGFECEGKRIGNIVQSDSISVDVSFYVEQSRNNSKYLCGDDKLPPPKHTSIFLGDNFEKYTPGNEWDTVKPTESANYDWKAVGGVNFVNIGGSHKMVADLNADDNIPQLTNNKEVLTATYLNVVGYNNIVFKYDRKTDDVSGPVNPQQLKVEYSVDDGSSWTTLETVNGESDWTTKEFSLSPSADNKPRVKVRFVLTGTNGSNHAYIDNVTVTGTEI